MNALKAYDMLNEAYEAMKQNDNQINRNVVLALLDMYNQYAAECPELYTQMKNAGDAESVWIIAA